MIQKAQTLSVSESAKRLGFTLKYVYDLVYSGRLPAQKVAGCWQISAAEVDARQKKQRREP